jgi:hypothetical protein
VSGQFLYLEMQKLTQAIAFTRESRGNPSSRYIPKQRPDLGKQQPWATFLRDHRDVTTAMDFFVVPTVSFHLLYIWFVIDHGRRRIIHFNARNGE